MLLREGGGVVVCSVTGVTKEARRPCGSREAEAMVSSIILNLVMKMVSTYVYRRFKD